MALGDFLSDTTVLDLSGVTNAPLHFMLSDTGPPPNGHPRSMVDSHGAATNAWDWAVESTDALVNKSGAVQGFVVSYVFPIADDTYLIGHSLGGTLDTVARLMQDGEYGDRVSLLVQSQWPKTFHLLREGAGMPNGYGLLKVRTCSDYWFVGASLPSRTPGLIDVDQGEVDTLRTVAFDVLHDAIGFPTNLQGLMEVLGTDRLANRLGSTAKVFSGLADLVKKAQDILG
jgi:hypothetical protein